MALGRGEGVPLGREVALGLGVTAVGLGVGSTDGDAGAVWAGTAVWPVPGSRFTIPTPARATTARPASGETATALTGARHSVRSTPASIAEAIGVGMAATARPSGLTTPDSINRAPVIRKAPTA